MQLTQTTQDAGIHDGQLLATFARTGREAMFEELVARHGTLVLNTCLRVLHERADAEDATQTVFLALATKARDGALQSRASLSGWLYAAALNTSLRARAARTARARHEQRAAAGNPMELADTTAADWAGVAPLLDGELDALAEKYRLPIVLHHLDRQPVEAVADALSCSIDAVKQRLSRGRELLRERLNRRGVRVAGAVLPLLLENHAETATLPVTFASLLARAAVTELARLPVKPNARPLSRWKLASIAALVLLLAAIAAAPGFHDALAHATRVRVPVPPAEKSSGDQIGSLRTSGAASVQTQPDVHNVAQTQPPRTAPIEELKMPAYAPVPKNVTRPPEIAQSQRPEPMQEFSGRVPEIQEPQKVDVRKFLAETPAAGDDDIQKPARSAPASSGPQAGADDVKRR